MPRRPLTLALLASLSGAACGSSDAASSLSCPGTLPSCPTPAPGYAAVAPIVAARCAPCHFPGGTQDGAHDFSDYAHVFAQRSAVLDQVHGCLMPPADATALSDGEYTALVGWLVCGAPQ